MGTIGQTSVDPTGLQSGIIGSRQVGPDQVGKQQAVCSVDVFGLKWIGVYNIFACCLPTVWVYTSIERIEFSTLPVQICIAHAAA
jgi:hypothetical protein